MKIRTLSALSLAGMLLAGGTVYSFTPPGRAAGEQPAAATEPEATGGAPQGAEAGARFSAAAALAVEATLGHETLVRSRSGETYLLLEVRGASGERATQRAPVSLALVIDRSGSMKGPRLQNAILAAEAAVGRLHDGDVLSVLTFDTRTSVVVPPTVIDARARGAVIDDLRRIVIGGDTCISCGLEDGMALLERTDGRVSRMVLLSDGDATAGVRDVPGFRAIAQRARDKGVSVTTVGVNVDYNERILSAIAEESNGQHYFVEDDAALSRALSEEAEALTRTVASDAEAVLSLAPGVELDRVYDRSFRRSDGRIAVPLGAFSTGEVKTVLLKLRVTPAGQGGAAPVAAIDVAYRDLVTGEPAKLSGALSAKLSDDPAQASPLDPVVAARVQRSETANALGEANRLFQEGRFADARQKLEEQATTLRTAAAGAKAAPSPRAGDAANDLNGQAAALDRASTRFKPPANVDPADPFQGSAEGKGAVRESNKSIFDLRR